MKHIVIHECYDKILVGDNSKPNTISNSQAKELEKELIANNIDMQNIIWGRNSITFINYVGFMKLQSFSIEILPKVSMSNEEGEIDIARKALLNMLSRIGYIKINYSELSYHKMYKKNLFEIFSYIFAVKLENELMRGPHLQYVGNENNLPFLKGKLLLKEQLSNKTYKNGKAWCAYEEFEANNILNQIFKLAIKLLLSQIRNLDTIKKLKYCDSYFAEIDNAAIKRSDLDLIKFDRTNIRFESAYLLAKMFIRSTSSSFSLANERSFSFLFKMNDLFEKYIAHLFLKHIDRNILTQDSRYKLLINEKTLNKSFSIRPDIVVKKNGAEHIVIDTKWKKLSSLFHRHGLKREDLFQMYVYLTRYELSSCAILLYPHNAEIETEAGQELESWCLENNEGKQLKLYSVDLSSEKNTIENLKKILLINPMENLSSIIV